MSDAANNGRTNQTPEWQRRYLATSITMPAWSPEAPEHVVYTSDESGSNQVWALDLSTGRRRQVTNSAVGIITEEMTDPTPSADGSRVVWFEDVTGDESGRWLTEPFDGGEAMPLFPETEVPVGWPSGLAVGRRTMAFAMGFDEGFVAYVARDGEPVRELLRSVDDIQVPVPEWGGFNTSGLSRDESLVAVRYTPRGNNLHMAMRVFDTATGDVVGELDDGEGMDLWASGWSPIAGDQRLVIRHELAGFSRPALWDVKTGARTDLDVGDLPGEIEVLGWWPDASAVLIVQFHDATHRLHRYDILSGSHTPIDHPDGCIWGAGVRPNGDVWLKADSGARAPRILSSGAHGFDEVLVPKADPAAVTEGHAFRSFHFENPVGDRVQGFVVTPDDESGGPFPTIMDIHGGPAWFWGDYWYPRVQSFVDHGYAVALINYRGSAGFGRAWRDVLIKNIGFPETEDLNAAADYLISEGIADPDRQFIAGKSWGGYLTLLGVGVHPDRWKGAIAEVPVGDYAAAYEDSAPSLQAMDRAYLGAPPAEIPEFIAERSPITYVGEVACPVMILYGDNDSRCPPRQVENYINALRGVGREVEVIKYGTGHTSFMTDENINHTQLMLDFLDRAVESGPAKA